LLTTVIDLLVVFLFTKPLVTQLAKIKFYNSGHPLSGLSPKSVGAKPRNPLAPTASPQNASVLEA